MFFSIDGLDGGGKSTQMDLFCDWLRRLGFEVVTCRDPGSTDLGEKLRDILLSRGDMQIDRRSEMLIYMAARAQLVEEVIRPAIDAGKIVVSDRYLLANIAYQGYARGLDIESVRSVGHAAVNGLFPDVTFVLDISVEAAAKRINRPLDRIESAGGDFLHKVRQGFLTESPLYPAKVLIIDAERTVGEIQQNLRNAAADAMNLA
jgi:dTMP kinase